jgi:glutamine amidotransferase
MNIKVINYETGNISSVVSALDRLGMSSEIVSEAARIEVGDTVLLPGVGSFDRAAQNLRSGGFCEYDYLARKNKVIGICLGFHLMCRGSAEGELPGLGLFDTTVLDLCNRVEPVLNLGWCEVTSDVPSFTNYHYFCHRYFVPAQSNTVAQIERDGLAVSNVFNIGNYWGIQSHPERSGVSGLRLLEEVILHEP